MKSNRYKNLLNNTLDNLYIFFVKLKLHIFLYTSPQQLQQKLAKKANDCEDAKNNLKNAVDKNQQLTERLSISEQKSNTENDQSEVSR